MGEATCRICGVTLAATTIVCDECFDRLSEAMDNLTIDDIAEACNRLVTAANGREEET